MNGFEMHGIDHLSASSINTFVAQPALWAMERLLKRYSPPSPAMARGLAVEAGVHHGLVNPQADIAESVGVAVQLFLSKTMFANRDSTAYQTARDDIAGYVIEGLTALRPYGVPTDYQRKIEVTIPGVHVPFHGVIDWEFGEHGMIIDLKTSEKHPSAIKPDHGRQASIYQAAYGNHAVRFAYVKPKPGRAEGASAAVVYELAADDHRDNLAAIGRIGETIERVLRLSADPLEVTRHFAPDYSSFYWSNPTARAHGREVFGF